MPAEWVGMAAGLLAASPLFLVLKRPVFFATLLFGFVAHLVKNRLVEARMTDLRDDADRGQFAVNLRLSREVAYGYDEGLVSFEDGWLIYTGRRCTFSVRRKDLSGFTINDKYCRLAFLGEAEVHTATLHLAEAGRFTAALQDWMEAKGVGGDAVYPPVRPNLEARRLHHSWMAIALVGALFFLLLSLRPPTIDIKPVYLILSPITAIVVAFYGREARRALDRIENALPYSPSRLGRWLGIKPFDGPTVSPDLPARPEIEEEGPRLQSRQS